MEVRDVCVRNGEFLRRKDELVSPSVRRANLVGGGDIGLQGSGHGNAHCHYLMVRALGIVYGIGSLFAYDHSLAVHSVLRKVFHIHLAEMSYAHMNRHESLVDIFENHSVKQLAREVQACGRSAHGAFVLREDGLEILYVALFRSRFNLLWNRRLA